MALIEAGHVPARQTMKPRTGRLQYWMTPNEMAAFHEELCPKVGDGLITGGFKTRAQMEEAVASGVVDVVGIARALVLQPSLPNLWMEN